MQFGMLEVHLAVGIVVALLLFEVVPGVLHDYNQNSTEPIHARIHKGSRPNSRKVTLTARPKAFLCSVVMLEDDYIQEWVRYNLLIGFDHIFLYDNNRYENSTDPNLGNVTRNLPNEFPGKVTVHRYTAHDKRMQPMIYTEIAYRFQHEDVFMAFFDVDEYFVLGNYTCVQDVLRAHAYEGRFSLGIHWLNFGSNGHLVQTPDPLTKRFQYRAATSREYIKLIVYCPDVAIFLGPVIVRLINGSSLYDVNGQVLKWSKPASRIPAAVSLHHYAVKSQEEYIRKMDRGEASGAVRDWLFFYKTNNDSTVFDDRAYKIEASYTPAMCGTWV